jgi:hypothetical protein
MRRLAVYRGRYKEFVEAPLMLWGTMGKRKKKERFLPIKKEWQNTLHLLPTLSVWSPSWNYCCDCSCHLRWWLLLLSGGEYMY